MLYWQFHRGNIDVETPNGPLPNLRPFLFPWLRRIGTVARAKNVAL